MFTALHSADKFLNEQQIFGLKKWFTWPEYFFELSCQISPIVFLFLYSSVEIWQLKPKMFDSVIHVKLIYGWLKLNWSQPGRCLDSRLSQEKIQTFLFLLSNFDFYFWTFFSTFTVKSLNFLSLLVKFLASCCLDPICTES